MNLAVSSSPRPWIAVFVLPEIINVFHHDSDGERSRSQGPKNVHSVLTTVWAVSWACWHVTWWLKCYWCFTSLFVASLRSVQRNIPRFCTRSICGWNLFQPLGLPWAQSLLIAIWNKCSNITICKCLISNKTNTNNFHPLEVVGRGSDT